MKAIYRISILLVGLAVMASCQKDEKPVLNPETEGFTLYTPSVAANQLSLVDSKSIEFVCAGQPDYGFTAPVTYQLLISLTGNFENEAEYKTLSTTAENPKFTVDPAEMAAELTTLSGKEESEFPYVAKVYCRAKAFITGTDKSNMSGEPVGVAYSNVVTLEKVYLTYALAPLAAPDALYMVGAMNDWDWAKSYEMVVTYDNNGTFWRIVHFNANDGFKVNTAKAWDGGEQGYAGFEGRITDNASSGITKSDDGNLVIANAGWYMITIKATPSGRKLEYSMTIDEPKVWLIGGCAGDQWDLLDQWLFTVPTTADGEFVSPAFSADSEVRACVKIAGEDWWHSEFIIFSGKIAYRGKGGDQDRVNGKAGQKLYLDFTAGTGSIK